MYKIHNIFINCTGLNTCLSQEKGNLITEQGTGGVGTCVFPFTHSGTTYAYCAMLKKYGGVGWCAWDYVFQIGRWGYCTTACHLGKRMRIMSLDRHKIISLFLSIFYSGT